MKTSADWNKYRVSYIPLELFHDLVAIHGIKITDNYLDIFSKMMNSICDDNSKDLWAL